ncbi:hypothetical protein JXA47_11190 [Candidatus Sumerlaeota bacterium]|nr:hypothetical protein [Candidatus Sumerlaeota bacterium]
MSESPADIVTIIETEQRALVEMIRANLDAEIETQTEEIIARSKAMRPIMRRLADATQRLLQSVAGQDIPDELVAAAGTWQAELSTLLSAIQNRATDLADRRALISQTLQRLNRATKGLDGYRQRAMGGARYVRREA